MIDEATKAKIIEEYLNNASGYKNLASSMIAPIKQRLFGFEEFQCEKCEMEWDDPKHVHTQEECDLYAVHGS